MTSITRLELEKEQAELIALIRTQDGDNKISAQRRLLDVGRELAALPAEDPLESPFVDRPMTQAEIAAELASMSGEERAEYDRLDKLRTEQIDKVAEQRKAQVDADLAKIRSQRLNVLSRMYPNATHDQLGEEYDAGEGHLLRETLYTAHNIPEVTD